MPVGWPVIKTPKQNEITKGDGSTDVIEKSRRSTSFRYSLIQVLT
jgi:hypothetical protein